MGRVKRKFTLEFKMWAVGRMQEQEQSLRGLSRETKVAPQVLRYWRELYLREGVAGLGRGSGRPRLGRSLRPLSPEEEIEALRKKVGEQQLALDFFRAACRRVEESRPASTGSGAKPSTASSRR